MGAVYRARDTRLDRDVAVKVVHPPFAGDTERMVRFEREARLLASLSHPHIATIHGLEHDGEMRFLVMELVPGLTLAERLKHGGLPVAEALPIASQIAAAIEAAHERGVIHRDLKPGNIMLTPTGTAKVLDFGLAKALARDSSADGGAVEDTRTLSGTSAGTVLGTAAYMSPEQARGVGVDRRTDVWAFGCVLYEMLTERRAFAGRTESDIIAAVLTAEPDWSALPADLPPHLVRLLHRCLEKDVRRRLRDIGDARLEIEAPSATALDVSSASRMAASPAPPRTRALSRVGAAAAIAALSGVAGWTLKLDPRPVRPAAHFSIALPGDARLAAIDFPAVAISPRETHIAYVAEAGGSSQLYVRPLESLVAAAIPGTEGAISPFFSPDGEWIGFFSAGKLKKVAISGGSVRTLADAAIGFGGAWGADGNIVFAPNNGSALLQVPADGGATRPVTVLDAARGEFSHRWPSLTSDGQHVIYAVGIEGSWDDAQIVAQSVRGGDRRVLVEGGTHPRYLQDGRLLYARGGAIFAMVIDARTGKTQGQPQRVLESIFESSDGAAQFSISSSGSIVYVPGVENDRRVVWVDHTGAVQPLAVPRGPYSSPRLSPDGRALALVAARNGEEIWIYDIAGGVLKQFTHGGGSAPVWSSDGDHLAFSATRDGPPAVFWRRTDRSGGDERLSTGADAQVPQSVSPDGQLAVLGQDARGNRDIMLVSLAGDHAVRQFHPSPASESAPTFSRNGRWIAYVSDESGTNEIYAARSDGIGPAVRLSSRGGTEPRWHPNSTEVFFRSGTRMMTVKLRSTLALAPGAERLLFDGAFVSGTGLSAEYDVSPDGARLLMLEALGGADSVRELRVILGWAR